MEKSLNKHESTKVSGTGTAALGTILVQCYYFTNKKQSTKSCRLYQINAL